jgi:two-component system, NtrC family, nitrogen regulation response regulator NtrX
MLERERSPQPLAIVVEDEGAIRILLAELLADEGYDVITFAQVDEAIEALQTMQPGLVVTDLGFNSPRDGWGVVLRMRTDPRLAHVPLVICSATIPTPGHLAAAERLLAHWLAKPFLVDDLFRGVDAAQRMVIGL